MQVMLISGSTSENSHTRALLAEASKTLGAADISTITWDLKSDPLPIADPKYHWTPDQYPDEAVKRFVLAVRNSDGFVLASPLYHGSFSGVLKNAIDLLWADAFRDKPVAVMSHGSGARRAANPCWALQPVITTMCGYPLQTQIVTGKEDYTSDADGKPQLANSDIRQRLERQAQEMARMMNVLRQMRDEK